MLIISPGNTGKKKSFLDTKSIVYTDEMSGDDLLNSNNELKKAIIYLINRRISFGSILR